MTRRQLTTTIYLSEEHHEQLKLLSQKTKIPVADYIRQGIEWVLSQYSQELPFEQLNLLDQNLQKK